jgi:hypothetical protein
MKFLEFVSDVVVSYRTDTEEFDRIARAGAVRVACRTGSMRDYAGMSRAYKINELRVIEDQGQRRIFVQRVNEAILLGEMEVLIIFDTLQPAVVSAAADPTPDSASLRDMANTINALAYTNNGLVDRVMGLEDQLLDEQALFLSWACVALVRMHLPYDPIARVLLGDVNGLHSIHEKTVADIEQFFRDAPEPYATQAASALERFNMAKRVREAAQHRAATMVTFAIAEVAAIEPLIDSSSSPISGWIVPSIAAAMDVILLNGIDVNDARFVRAARRAPLSAPDIAATLSTEARRPLALTETLALFLSVTQRQIDHFVLAFNEHQRKVGDWVIDHEDELVLSPDALREALLAATKRREAMTERGQPAAMTTPVGRESNDVG